MTERIFLEYSHRALKYKMSGNKIKDSERNIDSYAKALFCKILARNVKHFIKPVSKGP